MLAVGLPASGKGRLEPSLLPPTESNTEQHGSEHSPTILTPRNQWRREGQEEEIHNLTIESRCEKSDLFLKHSNS
jgi:hypothetical protein